MQKPNILLYWYLYQIVLKMRKIIKTIQDTVSFTVIEYALQLDPNRNSTEQLVTFLLKKLFSLKSFKKVSVIIGYVSNSKIVIKFIKFKK